MLPSQGPVSVAWAPCKRWAGPIVHEGAHGCLVGILQREEGAPAAALGGARDAPLPVKTLWWQEVAHSSLRCSLGEGDWGPIQGADDFPRAPPRRRPRGQVQGQMLGSESKLWKDRRCCGIWGRRAFGVTLPWTSPNSPAGTFTPQPAPLGARAALTVHLGPGTWSTGYKEGLGSPSHKVKTASPLSYNLP